MEKDIDRIPKNPDTDIVIRVDEFGGRRGVTIREFWRGERYTGFTKAGTKIPAEHFKAFKAAINSIDENELLEGAEEIGMVNGGGNGLVSNSQGSSGEKEGVVVEGEVKKEVEEDNEGAI